MKDKTEKINFKYNMKLYWEFLRKYKLMFIAVLFFVLLVESNHLVTQFLYKAIIDNGTLFASGELLASAFVSILLIIAGIYIGKTILAQLFNFLRIHLINRLDARLIQDIKIKFFNHLVGLHYGFHTTHKTGSLISKLTRAGGAVERMTDVLVFNFAPLILQTIVVATSLIYFSWIFAVIVLVIMIVFIIFSFIMQRIQETSNMAAIRAEDVEKANISDIFTNIESVKYYGKENRIKSFFSKITKETKEKALKNWDYYRWTDFGQGIIISIGSFVMMFFALRAFLAGDISIGTVVFVWGAYMVLIGPLFSFVHGLRNFYRAMADFDVLFEYNKIENKIKDKENARNLKIRKGEIEFENVDFSYGKRKIFSNFNLKIPADKKVAFVGHSGSGKTTLVKLLYRLHDVDSGSIRVDGQNVKDVKQESLRSEMAIVPQEAILFDDSIYNNIKFSNPRASRKQVLDAIKFAQLDKIIENFPLKEKTIVGERGVKLSGGEKQRVSIARAILADKRILVLDEATSALDSQTEFEIQQDLERLMQGRTSIIIAHRLSTVMKADKIVVLDKGRIAQVGTHRQLINQQGPYKKLWNLQKGGYIK